MAAMTVVWNEYICDISRWQSQRKVLQLLLGFCFLFFLAYINSWKC